MKGPAPVRRAAVVVNPSKFREVGGLRAELSQVFRAYGWAEPLWLETTVDDPGTGQALAAVEQGVELVCPLGGDGTVRCVAAGLLASKTPLGLLAAGTGNVLARNLGLPHRAAADALRLALIGQDRSIDVMRIELDRDGDGRYEEPRVGLVMTGIGLDAQILDATDERLKGRAGWLAYPAAGLRFVRHEQLPMSIATDGTAPTPSRPLTSILVGSCGTLAGGVRLMPGAAVDDGLLDAVHISAPTPLRWVPVFAQVFTGSRRSTRSVTRATCRTIEIRCETPAMVEIDGDVHGSARGVRISVDPRALIVRSR